MQHFPPVVSNVHGTLLAGYAKRQTVAWGASARLVTATCHCSIAGMPLATVSAWEWAARQFEPKPRRYASPLALGRHLDPKAGT